MLDISAGGQHNRAHSYMEVSVPIRETSISIPTTRGSGPRLGYATVVFPRQVTKAVAAIRGYQIGYHGEDHHVGILQVEVESTVNANVVELTGRLGCRDWSGHWDDEYNGSINATVFAELVSATAPPTRDDLQIMAVEVNQATQYFRSAEHLDAGNVMPDNSMPLVGGKMTGLRFYIDHDAGAGLPPIASLSGELTLRSAGTEITIGPLAPITPIAATEIDRAQAAHTLNFAVPAAWCRGRLEIALEVFDQSSPGPRSTRFRRTLQFLDVNPLRVYGVGINYTGMGLDLAAPTAAQLGTTFNFTRKVWPTGDILASGFTTLPFSESLAGNAANGCGSGFSSLLDQLKDIRGDTDDLVYGLLPPGTPLTGVGGCGGGGVGAGMAGNGVTAAHEAGHAVGRRHAPCDNTSRCDSPRNQDDEYPLYGSYVSDSIGEFGFDPATNVVHDPAARRDFMGYSGNAWISPYTYRKLLGGGDPSPYTPSSTRRMSLVMASAVASSAPAPPTGELDRAEWIRRRIPLLFLSAWVDGEDVTLMPSFTYPAYLRRPGPDTDFEVHLEGAGGAVVACVRLQQACGVCDSDCGPFQLQGEIPWEDGAVRLVFRRGGKDIASFDIETPPKLSSKVARKKGHVLVEWAAVGGIDPLHYLLQWQDIDGAWRGVAPRTTETHLVLPDNFRYARRDTLKLRLLAVGLLHTASVELEVKTEGIEPPTVIDVDFDSASRIYTARARDPMGRSMPPDGLVWYDEEGGEIAQGADLPLALTRGAGVATVRLVGAGVTAAEGFALLDPREDDDRAICGCRPGGRVAAHMMRSAAFTSDERMT